MNLSALAVLDQEFAEGSAFGARDTPSAVLVDEQGKVLKGAGQSVAVVMGIAGPVWLRFAVEGEAGHAGATPINLRRDALVAAAALICMIEEEAARSGTKVGTVGRLKLGPGGVNIIPSHVELSLDLRDLDEAVRDAAE